MKIVLVLSIIIFFGMLGYKYKKSLKDKTNLLKQIEDYVLFVESNITLFKKNIDEINYNYKIMQENKNAENVQNILKITNKNNKIKNILQKHIKDESVVLIILEFFENLGLAEYDFEIEKINRFKCYLDKQIELYELDIKNRGDLFFKIALAIGAILGICVW